MRSQRKKHVAALAYALGVCSAAGIFGVLAQEPRIVVTVTGSNIVPRIEGETSLPVQVITREDIERANLQTAAELLSTVSANMSFQSYHEAQAMAGSSQPGFASASLRGLSYNRTLILLNGRRVVNYALAPTQRRPELFPSRRSIESRYSKTARPRSTAATLSLA
jgi:iron complex outermembrane receptor protein